MVGCSRCTYPSIHLFVSRSRSVVRGALVCCVLCVHEGVVLCGVLVLVFGGGGVVCMFVSFCVFFFSFFSQFFFSCSRSFFLLSSFLLLSSSVLSSLPVFLLCSLLATAANFEAFQCDLAHDKCTAVGSLLPPPFSPSSPKKKKEGTFNYRNISSEGIFLHYCFILIQKNRHRVK